MPQSMFGLDGKIAVVTGSGRGIGKGIALAFADAGADVVVLARTQADIDSVAEQIRAKGRRALAVRADVTKAEDVTKAVKRTVEEFGRIDVWVNNAGGETGLVASTPAQGFAVEATQVDESEWDRIVDLNLKSYFLCSQAAGRVMIEQRGGSIINISSMAALIPKAGYIHYSAAKAGVINLTLTLADEWASHNVRVNTIVAGCINSAGYNWEQEMLSPELRQFFVMSIPLKRFGQPEDIAAAAVFFASDASSYVTGAKLEVSGGIGMHI